MVDAAGVRPGKVRLGCLLVLLVLAVVLYEGVGAFEVYFRYYRLQDTVNGQAQLAQVLTDDVILNHLVSYSDTLGLELGAKAWRIQRTYQPREIVIEAEYRDSVVIALPGIRKVFPVVFKPSARAPL